MIILNKHINSGWLIIFFSLVLSVGLYSQNVVRPSRQAAYDAFRTRDYEKAYREFNILLQSYSKDPVYKYYSGVCLVKLNKNPKDASGFLQDAVSGPQDLKSVPDDAWFYLGRSQQMSGNFVEAIKSFKRFSEIAGKKSAESLNTDDFINECNRRKGELKDSVELHAEIMDKAASDLNQSDPEPAIGNTVKSTINKPVITPKRIPEEYDQRLSEAMDYQVRADSLNTMASGYRKEYEMLPSSQKPAAKSRIAETESLSGKYQKLADDRFGASGSGGAAQKDTVTLSSENKNRVNSVQFSDSQSVRNLTSDKKVNSGSPEAPQMNFEIFSIFDELTDPEIIATRKIEIDPIPPAGLIYRIQIGVYSKSLTISYFKGIIPISGFKISGSAATRYFAGMFRRIADANKALLRVKQAGFKDSFLTAISDGKPVSTDRAAMLEKEWGQKPFLTVSRAQAAAPGDSLTPTLIFRVEVIKTVIPENDEATETYKKLAGTRGFEILTSADSSFVYLIGKFITFASASEYAGLLNRNGYLKAKVVAYIGNKEIPVASAKQLFEKLE